MTCSSSSNKIAPACCPPPSARAGSGNCDASAEAVSPDETTCGSDVVGCGGQAVNWRPFDLVGTLRSSIRTETTPLARESAAAAGEERTFDG